MAVSEFKISGACTICDAMCYEVMARNAEHERRPGEPKRLGSPNEDATRITFMLFDGTKADLTFCGKCAAALNPVQYTDIWRKVIRSWIREMDGNEAAHGNWFPKQYANGLLVELGRVNLKEALNGSPAAT